VLTDEQVAYFQTFGFIALPQLFSPDEMTEIEREFEEVLEEERQGQPFGGEKRQAVMAFAELRPRLMSLIDDDRIYEPIEQLLGPGFLWWGSDGNLYVGDTTWHPDAPDPEMGHGRIKIAFYLDPVTRDTGCIRFIPGSHRLPLHADLRPLKMWRTLQTIAEGRQSEEALKPYIEQGLNPDKPVFGVEQADLPGYSVESRPGDVVFFEQHLYHGSWGGRTGRRMFTLNYFADPTTQEQVDALKDMHEKSMGAQQALQYRQREHAHEEAFLDSDRPRIRRMADRLRELGIE
jgi:ectoine hydroxylase-related dioxygenase (phytanoyl-CoA dioxygenase family)